MCGCVFFYMPSKNNIKNLIERYTIFIIDLFIGFSGTPVCGIGSSDCLDNVRNIIKNVTISDDNKSKKCNCLPSCTSISYRLDASHSTADNSYLLQKFEYFKGNDM